MVLELKLEESRRLDDLLSQTWRGKKPPLSRPDKVKITADQVKKVKRLLDAGVSFVDIQKTTKLSEYHVRGVRRGRYNFLVEKRQELHRQSPRR